MKPKNMKPKNNKRYRKTGNYFIYARKSSEDPERQVQSIPDQIRIMKEFAERRGVKVIEVYQESISGQNYSRPLFNEMMKRVENGEVDGIIAWKFDRLSRNSVDTSKLQLALKDFSIKVIITSDRDYTINESGLLLSIDGGMAAQYSIDLSKVVRRGMQGKYLAGIRPTKAPIGYLNDKNNGSIGVKDPERFDIVRKMWDYMLTGDYSAIQIMDMANDDWGLRTRKTKKSGGNPISRSLIYKIFNSVYYAGYFYYDKETREGNNVVACEENYFAKGEHIPMITLEEYDRVQMLLGKKGNPRPQNYEFSYTGLIRCGECGNMITAEIKNIRGTTYIYYHCTKRNKHIKCNQKCIRIEALEEQIEDILESIEIRKEFKDWAVNILRESHAEEIQKSESILSNINRNITREEKKLNNLTDLLLDETLTRDEYDIRKKDIKEKLIKLKDSRDNFDKVHHKRIENVEEVFEFACKAKEYFRNGTLQQKREIFSSLGQKFILKDKVLAIELRPWFEILEKNIESGKVRISRFETIKNSTNPERNDTISSVFLQWSGT